MTSIARSWGDDVFGGFTKLSKQEADVVRDREVMVQVGFILENYKITKRRLVLIIEPNKKTNYRRPRT
jgi:hypothetical protein